jgi:hypothetical protein
MIVKGGSNGCLLIHLRVRRSAASIQNRYWLMWWNIKFHCLVVYRRGKAVKMSIERTRATTPPSLLGIDLRIV